MALEIDNSNPELPGTELKSGFLLMYLGIKHALLQWKTRREIDMKKQRVDSILNRVPVRYTPAANDVVRRTK